MHLANSLFATFDIILSNRTFQPMSLTYIVTFCTAYAIFIVIVRLAGGAYPYPFLNVDSFAKSLVLVGGLATVMMATAVVVYYEG